MYDGQIQDGSWQGHDMDIDGHDFTHKKVKIGQDMIQYVTFCEVSGYL